MFCISKFQQNNSCSYLKIRWVICIHIEHTDACLLIRIKLKPVFTETFWSSAVQSARITTRQSRVGGTWIRHCTQVVKHLRHCSFILHVLISLSLVLNNRNKRGQRTHLSSAVTLIVKCENHKY